MRTLFLLRHAKSSWEDAALSDHERPLNDRGRAAVQYMGELMRERELDPELIVSSTAVRARETAAAVKKAGGLASEVVFEPGVYEAIPNTLRAIIAAIDNRFNSAMIVGHNPGMEGIIYYLTGRVEPMPTSALAVIELDIENWSEVGDGSGRLIDLFRPKDEMRR